MTTEVATDEFDQALQRLQKSNWPESGFDRTDWVTVYMGIRTKAGEQLLTGQLSPADIDASYVSREAYRMIRGTDVRQLKAVS